MVEHFGLKLRKSEEDLRLNRNKYATITDTSRKNTIYEIYNYDSESWNKERMCDVAIYYFKYLEVYLESIMEKEPDNPLLAGKYPKNIEKQKIKIPNGCLGSKGSDRICKLSIYEEKKIECLWCYKNCCGYDKIFDETSLEEVYNNIKGDVHLIKNGVQLKNLYFPEYYGIFCSLMVENDYCFDFDIDDVYKLYNHIKNDLDRQWHNDNELDTYESIKYCYDTLHFLRCFEDRYENHLPTINEHSEKMHKK